MIPRKLNFDKIVSGVELALNMLVVIDEELFDIDISEGSLNQKIALYLSYIFYDYDVDIEYNRMGNELNPKSFGDEINDFPKIKWFQNKDYLFEELFGNPKINHEKLLNQLQERLSKGIKEIENGKIQKAIIPDIVIHKRKKVEFNLLIIEVKKLKRRLKKAILYDLIKLELYKKSKLKYDNCLFIDIRNSKGIDFDLYWLNKENDFKWIKKGHIESKSDLKEIYKKSILNYKKQLFEELLRF